MVHCVGLRESRRFLDEIKPRLLGLAGKRSGQAVRVQRFLIRSIIPDSIRFD
jgi:hypothetical protein